jgi:rubrerythrin
MHDEQVKELVLQSLAHEQGGVKVYEAAVAAAQNEGLKREFEHYLEQTRKHVRVLQAVCQALEIDATERTPGVAIVGSMGQSLVDAITRATGAGNPAAAELVACECVVLAETKDHLNWELLGEVAQKLKGEQKQALQAAYDEVEDEEDEHLYHSRGWCRELWLKSLGLKAVLPPPEERKHVKTAIGAARAEQSRKHQH